MNDRNVFKSLRISRKLIFNSIIFLLLVYFIYHTIYGNRGLISYFKLNQKFEKAYDDLKYLRAQRVANQHKVKLLKEGDRDLIDEKARSILGIASPKEQVYVNENNKN